MEHYNQQNRRSKNFEIGNMFQTIRSQANSAEREQTTASGSLKSWNARSKQLIIRIFSCGKLWRFVWIS